MCGLWSRDDHWSSFAKLPGRRDDAYSVVRSRQEQAQTISQFTRPSGASVRDWGGGMWIVEGISGGSEVVSALGDVWAAVERLTGRVVDPLDLPLVQSFERGRQA
ncbi:hypothetical protein ACO2Q9_04530 [Variovorax sp. VNK109]|uniref:hypothetical protein n=1 Tax=Variovorax sp. VNK109 TaxID=3400919 RepID=UPI003C0E8427